MKNLSRRRALTGGLALGALAAMPFSRMAAASAHGTPFELSIVKRSIEVNGRPASVFGLIQPNGTPGVSMNAGDRFRAHLTNECQEPALIHWHGLTPPNPQDGVPGVTQEPLDPGQSYDYDFAVPLAGTNWMHSHRGLQEQRMMAAPLIVRDPREAAIDEQEVVILLHDFSFRDPEEILAELAKGMNHGGHSMPMNGAAPAVPDMGTGSGHMNHDMTMMPEGMMNMMDHDMSGMGEGPGGMMMDLNDVTYDAYLANDRTLADPEIVRVERGGRVRLRIINAAASTNFMIDLGALEGSLIATDGRPILPILGSRFPLAVAQRADIRMELPSEPGSWPILARREGDVLQTGIILATKDATISKIPEIGMRAEAAIDPKHLFQPVAMEPLATRKAERRLSIVLLGDMMTYAWGLAEPSTNARNIAVREGERVELELINRSAMSHPMHLHGHHFQIVAVDDVRFSGAVRDTVLVPVGGRLTIAFDANNPGRWMFHCHNLYHMVRGMMTELVYV